ncbi:MAG: MFS transporter [Lachnospiraceae bacterium]|nr:MFS transporter [Lachnospiraceae bacterium]
MKRSGTRIAPVIACIITMLCVGIVYMWNVFQQPVMDHYGWERTAVSFISAVNLFMFTAGIFLGGLIADRKGPRLVNLLSGILFFAGLFLTSMLPVGAPWLIYITYGVLGGMGVGLAYAGATNCLQKCFPARRGFASALATCAFGTSIVVCVPIARALLGHGVPFAFRVLGAVLGCIVLVCSFFVVPPGAAERAVPAGETDPVPAAKRDRVNYSVGEALRDPRFWFMCTPLFFMSVTYMVVNPIIQTLGAERGLGPGILTTTAMLVGIASAVSRFIVPTLSDKLGRARSILVMTVVMMVCAILMIFARGAAYPVVIFLIVCAYSGPAGVYPAMSGDAFGMKNCGTIFGLAFFSIGFSSLFSTWMTGVIYRVTGTYTWVFVAAALLCLVPLVCLSVYDRVAKKRDAKRAAEWDAEEAAASEE